MLDLIAKNPLLSAVIIYFAIISLISAIVCIYDKAVSKRNKVELRIPKRRLLLLSALGGSVAMLLTMLLIRHKTRHAKFMIGIPLIIALQAAIIYFLFKYVIIL